MSDSRKRQPQAFGSHVTIAPERDVNDYDPQITKRFSIRCLISAFLVVFPWIVLAGLNVIASQENTVSRTSPPGGLWPDYGGLFKLLFCIVGWFILSGLINAGCFFSFLFYDIPAYGFRHYTVLSIFGFILSAFVFFGQLVLVAVALLWLN